MVGLNLLIVYAVRLVIAAGGLYAAQRVFAVLTYRPARDLQRKFNLLNPLKGRHRSQIVTIVGAPHAVVRMDDGRFTNRWVADTYAIELRFDPDGVCEAITHLSSA